MIAVVPAIVVPAIVVPVVAAISVASGTAAQWRRAGPTACRTGLLGRGTVGVRAGTHRHEVPRVVWISHGSRAAAQMTARAPLWRAPAVRSLVVLSLLGFTSFGLTLAALPSWAVQGGTSRATAGVVTTAMLACTVLAQAAVPAAERRFGIGPVLTVGLLALGAPSPGYLLSHDVGVLCAISAVRGVGFAVLTVLGATLTTRVAPADRLGEAVGVYGLAIAAPSLVAVPAGAILTLSGHFAWVAVAAASPLLALAAVPRLARSGADQHAGARRSTSAGTAARAALGPSLVLLVVTFAGGGLVTYLPIERPDGSVAGVTLLVFGITGALGRWRAGSHVDRAGSAGARNLLSAAVLCCAAGLVTVAALLHAHSVPALAGLLLAGAVFGIGFGVAQNVTQLSAFARAGPAQVTTASAVWNAAFDTGTGLGAFLVGAVSVGIGLGWTFASCALLILCALPVAIRTSHQLRQ